jgi:hypothetical protein
MIWRRTDLEEETILDVMQYWKKNLTQFKSISSNNTTKKKVIIKGFMSEENY